MNRLWPFFAIAVLAAGCGHSPRRGQWGFYAGTNGGNSGGQTNNPPPPTGGGGGGTAGGYTVRASGNARQDLNGVDQVLRGYGYQAFGPAVHGNLPPNGLIAYAVDAQPGYCYAVFALGEQPSQDLNLVLSDPSMRVIGADVRPDSHPFVVACPGVQGRVSARLQMASGGGGYYYAVYAGPMSSQPDLATFFGVAGGASTVQTAQVDPATQQRMVAVDSSLQQQGYHRIGNPIGIVMRPREDRNFPLNLQAGTCYSFGTFAGPNVRDTDVFLIDGSGNELTSDVSSNADGMVQYCAPPNGGGSYQLRARLYDGPPDGGALFAVPWQQGGQTPVATNNGGSNTPTSNTTGVMSNQTTAGAGLEDNFRLLDSDMHARGYESFGDVTRGQLANGGTRDIPIQLEGGKCYAILAVGDNGVRDLDLVLSDASGRQVDRDVEQDPRPIVRVCPTSSGTFSMQVRMYAGAGNYVYSAYRWPRGTRGPFGLAGLMYVRLAEVSQLLSVDGFTPDEDLTPGRGTFRREGETDPHDLQLQGGRCYSILAVGGEGVNDVDVSLSQGSNVVATDASRNAFPSVRFCPPSAGRYTLNVKAASGSGAYFYQVFRQGS